MSILEVKLIALVFTVAVNMLLAAFVYKNNPKSATNIIFGWLSLITSLWLIDVYISVNPNFYSLELLWIRLSVFLAVPQIALFFLLAHTMPKTNVTLSPVRQKLLVLVSALLMLDAVSPFLFTKVQITGKTTQATAGPGMALFSLFALFMIMLAIRVLFRKLRYSKGYVKEQFSFVFIGMVLMMGLLFFTVLLPVAIFKNSTFVPAVPLYTIIFLGSTTYAIVTRNLFDIRRAVARSVAYILVIGSLSLAYALVIFGLIDAVFRGANSETLRQIATVILIVPFALSFEAIRHFFDRLTNKLFYRDSYEVQDVLNKVGGIVVAEIELHQILNNTREVLADTLNSSFIEFVLFKDDRPYIKAHISKTVDKNTLTLGSHIARQHKSLEVVDHLSDHNPLKPFFRAANVVLSLKLKTREQTVGYVIFGAKKSGEVYSSQDEQLLVIIANELAIAVQNALRFEEIQNFNLTLQARVDEATRKLRHANEKLKEMDEAKDDFISMASHQLRTPLTSVKGYISLLLDGDVGKLAPNQKDMLNQAFFSSQRMVYIIADLLNVSRLKTGKFIIDQAPVNLAEMVAQELEQLKEMAASRSITLSYDKPARFPDLMLDETKTRQVIMNFVDNAIYYTPAGGHVTVRLIDKPSSVELRVEDDGIGVPKSEQPHLFTKFYRAGNARKARPDGTGLGLFMAKKIVIAQHGSIIFESKEGQGSTFGFILNKAKLAKPPA